MSNRLARAGGHLPVLDGGLPPPQPTVRPAGGAFVLFSGGDAGADGCVGRAAGVVCLAGRAPAGTLASSTARTAARLPATAGRRGAPDLTPHSPTSFRRGGIRKPRTSFRNAV